MSRCPTPSWTPVAHHVGDHTTTPHKICFVYHQKLFKAQKGPKARKQKQKKIESTLSHVDETTNVRAGCYSMKRSSSSGKMYAPGQVIDCYRKQVVLLLFANVVNRIDRSIVSSKRSFGSRTPEIWHIESFLTVVER